MYGILKTGIEAITPSNTKFITNLVLIPKKKVKNAKEDVKAVSYGVFYWRVKETRESYKITSKNPIVFNQ